MTDKLAESQLHGTACAVQRCATCDAVRYGPYCGTCGQKEFAGRHTLASLLRDGFGRVSNIEAGLAHTIYNLSFRPGVVVRDYLAGRTIRYTHPIGYFMLAVGSFALMSRLFSGPVGAAGADRIFAILLVPFVAAASRVLLWRADYNYAEHLVALMYLAGHALLVLALLFIGVPVVSREYAGVYAGTSFVLALTYVVWAYSRVFLERALIGAAVGLLALIAGAAMWFVTTAFVVSALRR